MIISKNKKKEKRIEIDLTGPRGNAYFILSVAQDLCKRHRNKKNWDDIKKRMTSGDYKNLLKVFEAEFGKYVVMYK